MCIRTLSEIANTVGVAIVMTVIALAIMEHARAAAENRKQAIEALGAIDVTAKVGSEGKLFGSIGVADVCAAIETQGQTVEKSEIRMPEGALRSVGEHLVDIHLYTDIDTQVTVNIIGEE